MPKDKEVTIEFSDKHTGVRLSMKVSCPPEGCLSANMAYTIVEDKLRKFFDVRGGGR
jgi:hypothetical protein